ncbi:hypothetical protein [Nonomuraea aurantiaca]|nr:hypothetical protein [Nonomuraea aurantiaca]MCA2228809.1 hypothetical protein [Nonomuraea aurantiaca]
MVLPSSPPDLEAGHNAAVVEGIAEVKQRRQAQNNPQGRPAGELAAG